MKCITVPYRDKLRKVIGYFQIIQDTVNDVGKLLYNPSIINKTTTMQTSQPKFPMRVYTAQDLAKFYKVCKKTFMRWLKPFEEVIGERQGRYYTINQVKMIIEKLGTPEGYAD